MSEVREKEVPGIICAPLLVFPKGMIDMNLFEGFPLLTTKKMAWKSIIHELLWFLRGETNIKYLIDNNVNIWNGDAYRWYMEICNGKGSLYCQTQMD